jgi:hypothetical protein
VVSGADGTGKTVLVEHFVERVDKEFNVLRAWDVPPNPDLPFYTVTGLLTDGGAYAPEPLTQGASAPQLSVLGMGAAVINLLDSLLEDAPVLFLLDDAHRIDIESLQAVGFALLRQRAEHVLTVVCTQQPAETVRDMGLTDLVPAPELIELTGFRPEETRDFVEDRTSRPHSDEKLRALAVWSDGNPLFLEAALGAFGGNLPDDPTAMRVPVSLRDAVGAWSRSFPAASRALLNMLAVLNAPATVPLLNELLGTASAGADADVLVNQHAAVWVSGAVPAVALVHAGQRDALYAAMPRAERNRIHLRAAQILRPPASWRHRVAAAETYDATLARELVDAAAREVQAGHVALAADHLFAAAQVDPDAGHRQEALVSAVRLHVTGGRPRVALRHEQAVLRSPDTPRRDEALGLLSLAKDEASRARSHLDRARAGFTARGEMVLAASAAAELGVAEGYLGLGVLTRSVVDTADRRVSVECGVAAVVVVGVEEVCQGFGPLGVRRVGPEVGPLVEERAVEAFDLAVGLGSVGAGEFAGRAEVGEDVVPGQALAVGPGVVGQDPFDAGDAVVVEEGGRAGQEGRAGRDLLVGVDLAVGQPGVVVDGGVDVVEAHAADRSAGLAAQRPMAAAVGNPAEFLHVDVDQLAGTVAFVAADDLPGRPVQPGQPVEAVAGQDPVHRRGGHAQDRADPGGSEFAGPPQLADPLFHRGRGPVRGRGRSAGPVVQARLALGPPPADPLVGRGPRYAHLGRDMSDRAARADPFDQQPPTEDGQPGITVGHEDLRAVSS